MKSVKEVLKEKNFRFNKQFGQNFITDSNFLASMVQSAAITSDDIVVEVGPGAGTLTREIAKVAKKVYAFEIDRNLAPVLEETLKDFNNVEVFFKDIQKVTQEELKQLIGGDYKVVANIPYYITTPIIMKFLEQDYKPKSISVMIQKEVAYRLVSKASDADYGVITLAIGLEGQARIVKEVSRDMFYPVPNVDSAIVRIDIEDKYKDLDKSKVKKVIKAAFSMRRKTLTNCLMSSFSLNREKIENILNELALDTKVRGENLDLDNFIQLTQKLDNIIKL